MEVWQALSTLSNLFSHKIFRIEKPPYTQVQAFFLANQEKEENQQLNFSQSDKGNKAFRNQLEENWLDCEAKTWMQYTKKA